MEWTGGDSDRVWRRAWSVPPVMVGVAIVQVVGTHFAAVHQHEQVGPAATVLLLAGPAMLAARLRWPAVTLVVCTAVTVAYYSLGYPYGPAFVSFGVAVLSAVAAGYRVLAWCLGLGGLIVYFVLHQLLAGGPVPSWTWFAGHLAAVAVIVALAELARNRQERQAERRRIRQELERRQTSEERLRIAQELHDVLAHNISLINVQAGVALHLLDQRPEQARSSLSTIKQASKEALNEMRSALAALRGDDAAPRTPTPGLERLSELTARLDDAGLPVRVLTSGQVRALPVSVDLAAYRIVQEALTNVFRHARASQATVRLAYGAQELRVTVVDDGTGDGPGPELTGGGNGIPGMRQRAASLGGSLSAGPVSGRGFRVVARLPTDGEDT